MKAVKIEYHRVIEIEIENTLKALQEAVGGYIETVPIRFISPDKAVMIVNEEGRLRKMEINRTASLYADTLIVGNALVVGVNGEEFTDVPDDIAREISLR